MDTDAWIKRQPHMAAQWVTEHVINRVGADEVTAVCVSKGTGITMYCTTGSGLLVVTSDLADARSSDITMTMHPWRRLESVSVTLRTSGDRHEAKEAELSFAGGVSFGLPVSGEAYALSDDEEAVLAVCMSHEPTVG